MKKRITAAELMDRLSADPEYLDRIERQDTEREKRQDQLRQASLPLIKELQSAGFEVKSVWDFVNSANSYQKALPILLRHLSQPYPGPVREGIARSLAVAEARFAWDDLLNLYLEESDQHAKDGLAVALSVIADDELLDTVIALVRDPAHGSSRLLLLSALQESKRPDAREVLEEMASDPDLEKEIRFLRKVEKRCKS